jgi:hypothetical protein
MALGEVKLSQNLPVSRPASISSKREFEKIISDICRIAASAKGISGQYLEAIIPKSQGNASKQWYWQIVGNASQVGFAALGIAATLKSSSPEPYQAFQLYSKVGDIFKGCSDANQSTYQMEQQKHQHASTHWQTWATGLQDLVRNLESAKQRLQQLEDVSNR